MLTRLRLRHYRISDPGAGAIGDYIWDKIFGQAWPQVLCPVETAVNDEVWEQAWRHVRVPVFGALCGTYLLDFV